MSDDRIKEIYSGENLVGIDSRQLPKCPKYGD